MTVGVTFTPPVAPSPGTDDKPEFKLLEAQFGDGYSQAGGDGLNYIRRVLTLTWDVLMPTDAATIIAFFVGQGGVDPFYWTPSDESTALLWTCDDWSDKRGQGGFRTVTATFKQCIA